MLIRLIFFSFILTIYSCQPSEKDVRIAIMKIRNEKDSLIKVDSIEKEKLLKAYWGDNYKFRIDSINKVSIKESNERRKFEIQEQKRFYGKKAWKMHKKHLTWTLEDCKAALNGKIWIGMDYDMIVYIRGLPNSVNTSNYGNGNKYQCCWDEWNPSCFYLGADNVITAYN